MKLTASICGTLAVTLLVTAPAQARLSPQDKSPHPALDKIHYWATLTNDQQRKTGQTVTTYKWIPDRHSSWSGYRWYMAGVWYKRYVTAMSYVPPVPQQAVSTPTTPTVGAFPIACVAKWESGNQNSWAGYFGFISPPSTYAGGAGYTSWYDIPYSWQVHMALLEYATYGGSAWGAKTRAHCGI